MTEKKVSEAINYRRSVRIYDSNKSIDKKIVKKCINQAILAPNSSNLQLWEFFHITSKNKLKEISKGCFDQPAAITAKQMLIAVVRKDLWRNRIKSNIDFMKNKHKTGSNEAKNDLKLALKYYQKTLPSVYSDFFGILGVFRYFISIIRGFIKPTFRELKSSDLRVIAHKSTALAAENFMISMAAYGYDTCPMEGFDSKIIKKVLTLPCNSEINMVIGCGIRSKKGIYGERFRIPFKEVYREL